MFVTMAASGASSRNVPSLSSASTTSQSPSSYAALVPTSFRSPPMTKLGCQPAVRRHEREHRRRRRLAVAAGDRDRAPRRDERTERFGSPEHRDAAFLGRRDLRVRCRDRGGDDHRVERRREASAAWPTCASTPSSRSRARVADSLRSEPLTRWPMRASTVAIALIPAPPMPTMCTARGSREVERRHAAASAGAGPAASSTRSATRAAASRPARDRAACAHRVEPRARRRGATLSSRSRRAPSSSSSRTTIAAPAPASAVALRVWWSAGRSGQRHEHRRACRPPPARRTVTAPARHTNTLARGVGRLMSSSYVDELVLEDVAGAPRRRDRVAHSARSRADRPRGGSRRRRGRASGRVQGEGRVVERPGARGCRPTTTTSRGREHGLARRTARISRRTGLPVSTAPRVACPASDTAARAPSRTARRFASPGAAFCSCTTAGTRRSRAAAMRTARRVAADAEHDARAGAPDEPERAHERGNEPEHARRRSRAAPTAGGCAARRAREELDRVPGRGDAVASRPRREPTKRTADRRVPAPDELVGDRERRVDVPAGASAR